MNFNTPLILFGRDVKDFKLLVTILKIHMENVVKSLSRVLTTQDTQIAIIAFLCFIGGWVVITKTIQFIFSILWPLVILAGTLMMFPIFPTGWFTENLTKYTDVAAETMRRIQEEFQLNGR